MADEKSHPNNSMRNAWLWLLGLPVALVGSFFVGEFLFSGVLGEEEGSRATTGEAILVLALCTILFLVPTLQTLRNGFAARRAGHWGALVPGWISIVGTVAFLGLNVASYLTTW